MSWPDGRPMLSCCLPCLFGSLRSQYKRVSGLFWAGECDHCGKWSTTLSTAEERPVLDRLAAV